MYYIDTRESELIKLLGEEITIKQLNVRIMTLIFQ